ncbi:hypothetical protein [Nonomuraea sp. 10N515B]|uniref:hypothetical protein n=1 Tax=Nonomuraea sp. 10N515B TaxID=3457422 RepID=UPI003FCE5416
MTDGDGAVLGVAFQVPVLDAASPGSFLLTAAHCVRPLFDRSQRVRIRAPSGSQSDCSILFCATEDVALLYHSDWLGEPLPCVADRAEGNALVRGAPHGVASEQATFDAYLAGVEGGLLDIVLRSLTYVESEAGHDPLVPLPSSPVYRALRGFSGAPVVRKRADGTVQVIGLVTHRNTRGIANRIYGIPTDRLVEILAEQDIALQMTTDLRQATSDRTMLTGLLGELLTEPGEDLMLWTRLSGLFYSGEPIDRILEAMLLEPQRYGLDDLALARAGFVHARLRLKRDVGTASLNRLREAKARADRADPQDESGLSALMGLRLLMEKPRGGGDLESHAYLFEQAIDRISRASSMTDRQKAYEIASAVGREAVLAYLGNPPPWPADSVTASYYKRLEAQHLSLLHEYGATLRDKQEVVHIGLAIAPAIWDISSMAEQVDALVVSGKNAAIQRSNAIFYCQMLLVEAMLCRLKHSDLHAFTLACLSTQALSNAGLLLSHEGVAAILRCVKAADPSLYRLVTQVHQFGIRKGVEIVKCVLTDDVDVIDRASRIAVPYSEQVRDLKGILTLRLDVLAE